MQTLVEIGPSNASQEQHRRKDATEQMKNLHSLGLEPWSSAFLAPMLYLLIYGCQWAEPEF